MPERQKVICGLFFELGSSVQNSVNIKLNGIYKRENSPDDFANSKLALFHTSLWLSVINVPDERSDYMV